MFWDKFVTLCSANGISPNGVCADLGFSTAIATKWKKGATPRDTTLMKIAEYFGTTVAYLTGVVDDPDPIALIDPSKKSPPIIEIIDEAMKDMSEEELEDLEKYIDFIRSKRRGGKS